MAFPIRYNDDPTLNIYALIFNESGQCYVNSVGFSSFNSDFSIVDHPVILSESRSGYYTVDINHSSLNTAQKYHIEIYSRAGADESYGADPIKASADILWNGQTDVSSELSPKIVSNDTFGDLSPGDIIQYRSFVYDNLGKLSNQASGLNYIVYRNNNIISSGSVLPTGSNPNYFYYANISTNSFATGSYVINTSGYYVNSFGNSFLKNQSTFNIPSNVSIQSSGSSTDVLSQLGYASGSVNDGAPGAGSFITNLSSSFDDFYNGQIIRFTEGSLIGQGRIISDYNGTTKRLTLNKSLSTTPTNGQRFIIYPIGGELGVS